MLTSADIRYLHFRQFDINEDILPKGGITVGWILTNKKLKIAISICNDIDRYNKSIGRNIVNGRLISKERSRFKFIFTEKQIQEFINASISPKYFISPIEFDITDISNTFIITFIKTILLTTKIVRFGKKYENFRC